MLRKLACLPVVPLIGGATARVQPVAVDDVARAVALIATGGSGDQRIVEIGGPEVLSFAEFLMRIRKSCGIRNSFRLWAPLAPIAALIKVSRKLTGERFPLSAGQLLPFVNDGVADRGIFESELLAGMNSLDETLTSLITAVDGEEQEDQILKNECSTLVRYLSGDTADSYVIRKYIELASQEPAYPTTGIDKLLVRAARRGPVTARIADAYARTFWPHGLLRRKIVLICAILENSPRYFRRLTSGSSGPAWLGIFRIAFSGMIFAAVLLSGILIFGPRHLLFNRSGQRIT
jgi:hypothetical protein